MFKVYCDGKLLATFYEYFDAINFFNKKTVHLNERTNYCISSGNYQLEFCLNE